MKNVTAYLILLALAPFMLAGFVIGMIEHAFMSGRKVAHDVLEGVAGEQLARMK